MRAATGRVGQAPRPGRMRPPPPQRPAPPPGREAAEVAHDDPLEGAVRLPDADRGKNARPPGRPTRGEPRPTATSAAPAGRWRAPGEPDRPWGKGPRPTRPGHDASCLIGLPRKRSVSRPGSAAPAPRNVSMAASSSGPPESSWSNSRYRTHLRKPWLRKSRPHRHLLAGAQTKRVAGPPAPVQGVSEVQMWTSSASRIPRFCRSRCRYSGRCAPARRREKETSCPHQKRVRNGEETPLEGAARQVEVDIGHLFQMVLPRPIFPLPDPPRPAAGSCNSCELQAHPGLRSRQQRLLHPLRCRARAATTRDIAIRRLDEARRQPHEADGRDHERDRVRERERVTISRTSPPREQSDSAGRARPPMRGNTRGNAGGQSRNRT